MPSVEHGVLKALAVNRVMGRLENLVDRMVVMEKRVASMEEDFDEVTKLLQKALIRLAALEAERAP